MATDTTTARGLSLPCPHCGEPSANIALELSDLATFTCRECDAEFTADDVQVFIAKWGRVLAWIGQAPVEAE